jgi:ABC-type multidrug transport system fused ATPase/permease subunit
MAGAARRKRKEVLPIRRNQLRRLGVRQAAAGIRFSLSIYWAENKPVLFHCAASVLLRVAHPFLGILLPKLVIDEITAGATPAHFLGVVGGTAALLAAVSYLKTKADAITDHAVGTVGILRASLKQQDKRMSMDFSNMEDPAFLSLENKAEKAFYSNHTASMNIPRTLVRLMSNLLGFALYAGLVASVHPLMLLVLFACSAVNWLVLSRARRFDEKTREERSGLNRKVNALLDSLRAPASAKDIRLYNALPWLSAVKNKQMKRRADAEDAVYAAHMRAQWAAAALILLRDGAAYALLVVLLLDNRLALGDFVMMFAAIGALAGWVSGILVAASDMGKASVEMTDVLRYFEYPDRMNTGSGEILPSGDALPPSITLRNVSYTYPGAEKPALDRIDLHIAPGERLAVVGANGAGKTTLVKLICGLYLPSQGKAQVNGHDMAEYNRDELYRLFAPVFQDIHLLSADIAGNISQATPEETDSDKLASAILLSGLDAKIGSLPAGEKTRLVRALNADAIELSGGEKQKLAMARALYKDAPVLLLDEPTAALDPLAENEVYEKYAELTRGKTSVYISHRLASTRFCDRIILLDGSRIAEQGTHDELIRKDGMYARMFEVQSSYYAREGMEDAREQ